MSCEPLRGILESLTWVKNQSNIRKMKMNTGNFYTLPPGWIVGGYIEPMETKEGRIIAIEIIYATLLTKAYMKFRRDVNLRLRDYHFPYLINPNYNLTHMLSKNIKSQVLKYSFFSPKRIKLESVRKFLRGTKGEMPQGKAFEIRCRSSFSSRDTGFNSGKG